MSSPFELQSHLDYLYDTQPRRLAFSATTPSELEAWQRTARSQVLEMLGLAGRTPPAVPKVEKVDSIQRDGYVEEKYALDVGEGVLTPIYLLIPEGEGPFKPVLSFPGHFPSVQHILGEYPDAETAERALADGGNYAQSLAQAGFLVCAIEQRGFGERLSADSAVGPPRVPRSCRALSFEYMMQGRTLTGERCWDGICAINYLQSRDDLVATGTVAGDDFVVGCMGNSGGGSTALWLSAIDERISVSVPSSFFCSFKASILGMQHCECNYVPHALEWLEMGELGALIAPRPFRVVSGEADPIFPIQGTREQFETVQRAYDLLDAGDRCSLTTHPGGHAHDNQLCNEWFLQWL